VSEDTRADKLREVLKKVHQEIGFPVATWGREKHALNELQHVRERVIQIVTAALEADTQLERPAIRTDLVGVEGKTFVCKARTSNMGPQDCDWPFCGCDPYADKAIEAIQESGFTLLKDQDLLRTANSELERPAEEWTQKAADEDRPFETNAEFRNPEKAWLMIWRHGKECGFQVSEEQVKELLGRLHWLAEKFENYSAPQPPKSGRGTGV
jgi:hypothetical protein